MGLFSSSSKSNKISSSVHAIEQPINTQSNAAPVFHIIDNSKSSAYKSRADQNKDINLSITNTDYGAIDAALMTAEAINYNALLLADSVIDSTTKTLDNTARYNRDNISDITWALSDISGDSAFALENTARYNRDNISQITSTVENVSSDTVDAVENLGDLYSSAFNTLSDSQENLTFLTSNALTGGLNTVLGFAEKNIQEDKGTTAAILQVLGWTLVGVSAFYAYSKVKG